MLYGSTTQAVSRFRPFACWSPSHPTPSIHIMDRRSLGRTTRGSRHRFQRSSIRFSAALRILLRLPPTSLLAVINAFRLHVTRGSRHRFQPRPFAFRQLDHHPAPSFTPAFISPGPSSAGARMLRLPPPTMTFTINTLPPTHELEFGLPVWVVTAWSFPSPQDRVPRRGWRDISLKA